MKQRTMVWILPVLLAGVFFVAGIAYADGSQVAAQPVSAAATLPQPIINVLVGPEDLPGGLGARDSSVRVALAEPVGQLQQESGASSGAETPQQTPDQQANNVITLRIEIVVVTEGAEAAGVTVQPGTDGAAPTESADVDQAGGEGAAAQPQATPTVEAAPAEATPAPEAAQAQATPGAEAAPTESSPEESSTGGEADTPPMPGGEGAVAAGEEAGGPSSAPPGADQELLAMGEYLYSTTCANCHQLSGLGNTAYPPLKDSPLLTANDPTAAILMVLQGRGHMPAFADALTDQEVAAILSHERTAWENSASIVSAEQVSQARAQSGEASDSSGETQQPDPGQTDQGQTDQGQAEQGEAEQGQDGQSQGDQSQDDQGQTEQGQTGAAEEGQATDPAQNGEAAQPQPAPQATNESTENSTTDASTGMVIPIEIHLVMLPPSAAGE